MAAASGDGPITWAFARGAVLPEPSPARATVPSHGPLRAARCCLSRPRRRTGHALLLGFVLERPDLHRPATGGGTLGRPVERGVQVGGLDDPEPAQLLLGLRERPVGRDHLAALRADDRGGGRRVEPAGEHPGPGRLDLSVVGVNCLEGPLYLGLGRDGLSVDRVRGEQVLLHAESPFLWVSVRPASHHCSRTPVTGIDTRPEDIGPAAASVRGWPRCHSRERGHGLAPEAFCCVRNLAGQAPGWAGLTWTTPPSTILVSNAGWRAVAGPCTTAPSLSRNTLPCQGQVTHGSSSALVSVPWCSGPPRCAHRSARASTSEPWRTTTRLR